MPAECEPAWARLDTTLTTLLAYLLNGLLLFLILRQTAPELRPYRKILLTTCLVDLWTCTVLYVYQLKADVQNDVRVFYLGGALARWLAAGLGLQQVYWLCVPLFSALVMNGYSMIVPFAYRYLMICRWVGEQAFSLGKVT